MTTPAIIDAVAHAIYAAVWPSPTMPAKPWQDLSEVSREVWRKAAVAALDAAKPKRKRGHLQVSVGQGERNGLQS